MLRARRIEREGPWRDAGALFAWGALVLAAMAQIAGGALPVVLGLVFFVAGLAHGAGDEQEGRLGRFGLVHAVAYLVVGAAVAGLFLAAPLAGLALFLALSAWHFARSDCAMGPVARAGIAALATGGSALFQARPTERVFEAILGAPPPIPFMTLLAVIGGGGIAAAAVALFRNERGCGEAIIALLAVWLLHPVLAVGTIFLVGHAIPIQRRQVSTYGGRTVVRAVALPTVIATLGAALLGFAVWSGMLALPVAAALAFGLATPHMLTERLER